jgi:hypothetical protein
MLAVEPAIETVALRSVELQRDRERDPAGVDRGARREGLRDERCRRGLDRRSGVVPAPAARRDRGAGGDCEGKQGEASKLRPGCAADAAHEEAG